MEKTKIQFEPGAPLTWRVHLLREEPKKLLFVLPIVGVGLLVSYLMFHNLVFLAATLFLFASSLAEYLFPIRYTLDERGATMRTLFNKTFIEWDRVKKYYLDERGIKLSPLAHQGRLEAFRGVYLRFGARRDEVVETVRRIRDELRADA